MNIIATAGTTRERTAGDYLGTIHESEYRLVGGNHPIAAGEIQVRNRFPESKVTSDRRWRPWSKVGYVMRATNPRVIDQIETFEAWVALRGKVSP